MDCLFHLAIHRHFPDHGRLRLIRYFSHYLGSYYFYPRYYRHFYSFSFSLPDHLGMHHYPASCCIWIAILI